MRFGFTLKRKSEEGRKKMKALLPYFSSLLYIKEMLSLRKGHISVAVNMAGCIDVTLKTVMYLFCPRASLHALEHQVLENLGSLCHCSHKQYTKTPQNCGIKVNGLPQEQNQV